MFYKLKGYQEKEVFTKIGFSWLWKNASTDQRGDADLIATHELMMSCTLDVASYNYNLTREGKEDIIQEALIRFLKATRKDEEEGKHEVTANKTRKYKSEELEELLSHRRGYFIACVKSCYYDSLKKVDNQKTMAVDMTESEFNRLGVKGIPEKEFDKIDLMESITAALEGEEELQQVITYIHEGYTTREIAGKLSLKDHKSITRRVKTIREKMQGKDIVEERERDIRERIAKIK